MAKAQAHFRLEAELLEAMKLRAEEENITITELVTRFLKQGLGIETNNTISAINQQQIEEIVYQRVSESISNKFSELENCVSSGVSNKIYVLEDNVFSRVLERVSLIIDELEKRISERVSLQQLERDTIANIEKLERVSTKEEPLKITEATKSISNDVSQRYTEGKQQELIVEIPFAPIADATLESGEIMKPAKLVGFLNTQTQSKDWNIDKLKNLKRKHLTWLKNSKNPDKKVIKDQPLPIIIEEYLIDWVFSEEESPTSTGKEWWIQKLPQDKLYKEVLIELRRKNWIKVNDQNLN